MLMSSTGLIGSGAAIIARENEARVHKHKFFLTTSLGLPITSVEDFKVFNESLPEKANQQKYVINHI